MDPIIDETPTHDSARSHRICPVCELGAARSTLARVGYDVQPAPAAPPSAKKLARRKTKAGHMNQYDIMFSLGKAMSLAPIISGIRKLPMAPVSQGLMTKKIISVACMLKSML